MTEIRPEGGPLITLEYALVDPATAPAREMTDDALKEALGNWLGWRARYGNRHTDQGLEFLRYANLQLGRIRRERKRREKLAKQS